MTKDNHLSLCYILIIFITSGNGLLYTSINISVNGNWTIWSEWSLCPVSCGGGQHSRSRSCTNPAPMYGGTKCEGDKTENKLCNSQHCPSEFEFDGLSLIPPY